MYRSVDICQYTLFLSTSLMTYIPKTKKNYPNFQHETKEMQVYISIYIYIKKKTKPYCP